MTTKQKLPYEASVWRTELLSIAADIEQAIQSAPPRNKGETLLAYVRRTRREVDALVAQWHTANEAMHDAIKRGA